MEDRVVRILLPPPCLSRLPLRHSVPGSEAGVDGSVGGRAVHMRLVVIAYVYGATLVTCRPAKCDFRHVK